MAETERLEKSYQLIFYISLHNRYHTHVKYFSTKYKTGNKTDTISALLELTFHLKIILNKCATLYTN